MWDLCVLLMRLLVGKSGSGASRGNVREEIGEMGHIGEEFQNSVYFLRLASVFMAESLVP